jgi:hypothetical protein
MKAYMNISAETEKWSRNLTNGQVVERWKEKSKRRTQKNSINREAREGAKEQDKQRSKRRTQKNRINREARGGHKRTEAQTEKME